LGDSVCGASGALTPCRPTPVAVAGLSGVAHVAVGDRFACASRTDGSVWCWGRNDHGELGHDPSTDSLCAGLPCKAAASPVGSLSAVSRVFSGGGNACAVSAQGALSCWGSNAQGSLGDGVVGTAPVFTPVPSAILSRDVVEVALSAFTPVSCARKTDRSAWCWGDNFNGALAHGPGSDTDLAPGMCNNGGGNCNPNPHRVADDQAATGFPVTDATGVLAQDAAACALRSGGAIWCWGFYGNGLLWPAAVATATPAAIAGFPQIASVTGNGNFACALATNKSVWCWGINSSGQLGVGNVNGMDGGTQCQNAEPCAGPHPVANGFTADAISASVHTVALRADGTVWGWGPNTSGELGHNPGTGGDTGTPGHQFNTSPTQVMGLP
jgi:alpha-tubulin suppressor-like RCC1 family protein